MFSLKSEINFAGEEYFNFFTQKWTAKEEETQIFSNVKSLLMKKNNSFHFRIFGL